MPLLNVSLAQFELPTALLVETVIIVLLTEFERKAIVDGMAEAGSVAELVGSDVIETWPWKELALVILTGNIAVLPTVAFWAIREGVMTKSGVVPTTWLALT